MVPFWVTSSWATLWKNFLLFVLNITGPPKSTENILFSSCTVQSFCCHHHWFGPSKIAPSTVRIDKTQKSGHLVTIFCWGEAMPIPAHILLFCFYFRKASNASLHLQKANIPSVCVHCITEEFFHCHANETLQSTTSNEHMQMKYWATTRLRSSTSGPQLSQLPRKIWG